MKQEATGELVRRFKNTLYADDSITDPNFPSEKANKLYKQILDIKAELNNQISTIETHLSNLIQQNEYDYAMSYNIYAKNKEKQLKQLIGQITARYDDKKLHDKKMHHMETQLGVMR